MNDYELNELLEISSFKSTVIGHIDSMDRDTLDYIAKIINSNDYLHIFLYIFRYAGDLISILIFRDVFRVIVNDYLNEISLKKKSQHH